MQPSNLEQIESLEQLRFIENDLDIVVDEAITVVPAGVDTPADMERVRSALGVNEVPNKKTPS
jgi:3-deoxy-manno-octulosonate cytidylyltransferase (CMP-KDO synthetase)